MPDFCDPCKSRGKLAAGTHLFYEGGKTIRKCDFCRAAKRRVLRPGETDLHPEAQQPSAHTAAPSTFGLNPGEFRGLERSSEPKSQPAAQSHKEQAMPHPSTLPIDWSKVQERRDNGERVADLAVALDCDPSLIYARTKSHKKSSVPANGTAPARNLGKMSAAAERAEQSDEKSNGFKHKYARDKMSVADKSIAQAITELRAKRDAINKALEALELLQQV